MAQGVAPWQVGPESWPCLIEGCHPWAAMGEGRTPFLGVTW